jgi:predicted DNA-binding protein YlxM (UPF0122 family)
MVESMKTKDKVIRLRLLGKSYNEISKQLSISKPTVSYHCISAGLNEPIDGRKILNEKEIIELNEYYKKHTILETAEKFNVSRTTVIANTENKRIVLNEIERRKRNYERVKSRRQKLKEMSVEYLGGKCMKCGYNKCIAALDFHHRDPNEKEFSVSKYQNLSWLKIMIELDKCDLLCSNCHRELHYEEHWDVSPHADNV